VEAKLVSHPLELGSRVLVPLDAPGVDRRLTERESRVGHIVLQPVAGEASGSPVPQRPFASSFWRLAKRHGCPVRSCGQLLSDKCVPEPVSLTDGTCQRAFDRVAFNADPVRVPDLVDEAATNGPNAVQLNVNRIQGALHVLTFLALSVAGERELGAWRDLPQPSQ
jgi:hypothetical protein